MAGLANILFVFAIWGYQYGFSAITYAFSFWVCGLLFFRFIAGQPKIREFVAEMGTLHEFLGFQHHGARDVRKLAAQVSIASFLIVIGFEVYVGGQVLQVFVPRENAGALDLTTDQTVLGLAFALCLVVSAYAAMGGYRSVIATDQLQGVILLVAFIVTLYLIWDTVAIAFNKATWSSFVIGPGDFNFVFFVVTNLIGWTLWFPTTMDMWQRCAATRSVEVPRQQILFSLVAFFGITVFGVLIGIFVKQKMGDEPSFYPALDFLRILLDSAKQSGGSIWPLAIILAGFIAAMMSTVDTFTIAATQAYFSDIRLAKRFEFLKQVPAELQRSELNLAMVWAFLIPVSSFMVFFVIHWITISPVAVFVVGYSLQLSLLVPILYSVFGRTVDAAQATRAIHGGVIAVLLLWGRFCRMASI